MKKQFVTLVFTFLSWAGYAQNSFNEVVFNEMMQGWAKDPVGTLKSGADPNFTFINGNGKVMSLAQLIDSYTNGFTESDRKIEQLNVRQSGSTGIATGILTRLPTKGYLRTRFRNKKANGCWLPLSIRIFEIPKMPTKPPSKK